MLKKTRNITIAMKTKKTIRILATVTTVVLLLFLGAGCMKYEDIYKKKGNDAIEYISAKYQLEFKPVSYDISDYLSDGDVMACYTEGMDTENEHVSVFVPGAGDDGEFHDNYFDFIVRDEVENHISDMVERYFGECKVYKSISSYPLPDELKQGNTLDDLYKLEPNYEIWLQVFVKDPGYIPIEDQIKKIEKELAGEERIYVIQIYTVDKQTYDSLTRYSKKNLSESSSDNQSESNGITRIYYASIVRGEIKEYE